ncbi:MAG TPA: type IV pilus assembly protein PilM [Terriglobia bacterium]|nr:type IV pilus assembly protein PilM [Terriglobia bacterium]
MFWRKSRKLVGLDIGSSSVKAVELARNGDTYELVNLGFEALGQDVVVDGSIMDALLVSTAIEKIFTDNKIKTRAVATSVSGHSVIVKRVAVSAGSDAEVASAIPYEAQQYIPFDVADVNLSYQIMGPAASNSDMDVMLVAVKREKILNQTNVLSQAGRDPVVVDIDSFALENAFEANYDPPSGALVALLNIGASIMNINIVRDGASLFTRDVAVGGNQYTDTLQKELDLSFEDAEKLKQGHTHPNVSEESRASHLRSVSEILLLEIQKTFDFFRQTTSTANIEFIYLAGGTAKIEGLAGLLKEEFSVPVEVMDPFRKVHINPARFDVSFTAEIASTMCIAMGLALRSFDLP